MCALQSGMERTTELRIDLQKVAERGMRIGRSLQKDATHGRKIGNVWCHVPSQKVEVTHHEALASEDVADLVRRIVGEGPEAVPVELVASRDVSVPGHPVFTQA
mmetsp:Transcript_22418/g.62947  ORF Transcript_22418/g.62947 Transcript_22418/m.62947 type:complete len:104 (-) Transcript_22418:115-426(-)